MFRPERRVKPHNPDPGNIPDIYIHIKNNVDSGFILYSDFSRAELTS